MEWCISMHCFLFSCLGSCLQSLGLSQLITVPNWVIRFSQPISLGVVLEVRHT